MTERKKIILFEDDPEYAKVLKETLIIEGFDVVWMDHAGGDCEEIVWAERPNLILLEAFLKDTDGFQVAYRLKTDLRIQRTPIVFLSDVSHPTEIQRGRDVGAVEYLVKSRNAPRDIAGRLKAILGQPTAKLAPRVRVARLPEISSPPQRKSTTSALPKKRWFWIGGLVLVCIAGVRLSLLFSKMQSGGATSGNGAIPIAYIDPSACQIDDDCRMIPGCCSISAVNIYHIVDEESVIACDAQCPMISISVACLDQRCAVVTAEKLTDERILYGVGQRSDAKQRLDSLDCAQRQGEYRPCDVTCPEGTTDCTASFCSEVCLLKKNILPIPVEKE
ncbi:MAG: response regulator [bacterium]